MTRRGPVRQLWTWLTGLQSCRKTASSLPANCKKTEIPASNVVDQGQVEDWGLLGCDAVSLAELLPTFRTVVVPSSSGLNPDLVAHGCILWCLSKLELFRSTVRTAEELEQQIQEPVATVPFDLLRKCAKSLWQMLEAWHKMGFEAVPEIRQQHSLTSEGAPRVGGAFSGRTIIWGVCRLFYGNAFKQMKYVCVTEYKKIMLISEHLHARTFRKSLNITLLTHWGRGF